MSSGGAAGRHVYHGDGLGSVRSLTDALGTGGAMLGISDTFQFDEFGIPGTHQGTSTQPFGFGGMLGDSETGLLGGYDPATGRAFPGLPLDGIGLWPCFPFPPIFTCPEPVPAPLPPPPPEDPKPIRLPRRIEVQAPNCPGSSGTFYDEIVDGRLVLGRGPEGGPMNCHVNAQVVPGTNWHIYWEDTQYVARTGATLTLGLYLTSDPTAAAATVVHHLVSAHFHGSGEGFRLWNELYGELPAPLRQLKALQTGATPT
jgi:hypothetical protein